MQNTLGVWRMQHWGQFTWALSPLFFSAGAVEFSPFWPEFLTEWPNVRFGAVVAVGENLWGRPLDWELGTCGAGVLIIQDNPGRGKEGECWVTPIPWQHQGTVRSLGAFTSTSQSQTLWPRGIPPPGSSWQPERKKRCKGIRSEPKHSHSHSGAFILEEQIMLLKGASKWHCATQRGQTPELLMLSVHFAAWSCCQKSCSAITLTCKPLLPREGGARP